MKGLLETTTSYLAVLLVGGVMAGYEGASAHAAQEQGMPAFMLVADFPGAAMTAHGSVFQLAAASDDQGEDTPAAGRSDDAGDDVRDAASSGGSTAGVQVEDNLLTTQVKAALLAEPEVGNGNIQVQADHGNITLSGSVSNEAQLDAALRVARGVEGVRRVKNNLRVGN